MKSEEFIREVDEELRRDQMARLWGRYGGAILVAALLIVAFTAGKVYWDHRQTQARAAEAMRFAAAQRALLADQKAQAADEFAAIAADGPSGIAGLARLKEAEARLAAGDQAGATAALAALTDGPGDAILQQLAELLLAEREIADGDPAELKRRLEPLAAAEAPWRHQAQELLALLAIRTGSLEEARKLLTGLSQEAGVAPTQQRRAEELLHAIGGATPQAAS